MLLILANFLSHTFHIFRIFQYITFRAICSALTAMFIVLFYCPKYIQKLMSLQIGQVIRSDGPHSHLQKSGTPTMGGLLILIAFSISMLLWGDLDNRYIWIGALVTLGFGMIGCIDDYRKIVKKNSKGLSAKQKLLLQSLIAFIAISILYFTAKNNTSATQFVIPFLKNAAFQLGIF
ncbi:MAG: phospho-N-acetylmuramoyl-pentapeptide-transferase, partial [uncultured bacterium]